MSKSRDDWGFGEIFAGLGPWSWKGSWGDPKRGSRRRRQQVFESGELKYVILKLIREKPRHGYEVIKALEEKLAGCYTPSAGAVYPTLQLLEDQGLIRGRETEGKKVYHITPEGEAFLEQHRDVVEEIVDRVRDTVRDFAGGAMGDLNSAFGRVARATYGRAWKKGPEHPAVRKVAEILRRTAEEIEQAWESDSQTA